ncbi:cyclic nucleotide-binding protein [Paucimonas lemoignei]|uniref:Cyclic nucleotide-binding protein n=1 Tax=Paucimonas lemoignei TaxID=29443 RepID=A0A4R3HW80_PAULE|nr:cyclic nucleotide-binding domain-containing protein [Paucimonas lemoignei]TCS37536.1 cyclic nucleotide-binding protein [Paucimonas lemoignei]
MDLKYFLKNLPAFEDFATPHLEALAKHLHVTPHADGQVFIRQGEQGAALYLLLKGAVHITQHDNGGEEYMLRELADGEMFGILSLVDDMPASATCTAKGPGETAALSREAFQALFEDAAPVAHHLQYMIAVQMARDIQEANKRSRAALAR